MSVASMKKGELLEEYARLYALLDDERRAYAPPVGEMGKASVAELRAAVLALADKAGELPTPEEAERIVQEAVSAEPESEVQPDEFARGIGKPAWESPLPENVVDELRQPLDPNRIRRRKGRGRGQFEYLAGHDDKRRANELFGFGNWGYTVESLTETAAVQVENDDGKPGWHVSYTAIVRVEVRGCLPFSDVGYGDGVEYGAAALATARELATKEAVTDAMKRALTGWGDQFGLILYAKADEKQRIDRDRNAEVSQPVVRRDLEWNQPQSWAELTTRLSEALLGEDEARAWMVEVIGLAFGGRDTTELSRDERTLAFQKLCSALYKIETRQGPELAFDPEQRKALQVIFAEVFDGVLPFGPPWRLGPSPDEASFPTKEEYDEARSIEFGAGADVTDEPEPESVGEAQDEALEQYPGAMPPPSGGE